MTFTEIVASEAVVECESNLLKKFKVVFMHTTNGEIIYRRKCDDSCGREDVVNYAILWVPREHAKEPFLWTNR